MGVSIHKVAKEKLHKHGFKHIRKKLRHCPASQTVACSNTWSQLFLPCRLSHCSLHNCSLWAPLGRERYCNLAQSACIERLCTRRSQIKYTFQGCAYDCAYANVRIKKYTWVLTLPDTLFSTFLLFPSFLFKINAFPMT